MKTYAFLFFNIFLVFSLFLSACSKDDDDNNGGNNTTQQNHLTSQSWTTYKILNSGNDVTSSVSPMTLNFKTDGTFTASGFGSASGSWTLSGSSLNLGSAGTWTVLELNASSLKIRDSSGTVEAHFN